LNSNAQVSLIANLVVVVHYVVVRLLLTEFMPSDLFAKMNEFFQQVLVGVVVLLTLWTYAVQAVGEYDRDGDEG
jgi:hypothetical protein